MVKGIRFFFVAIYTMYSAVQLNGAAAGDKRGRDNVDASDTKRRRSAPAAASGAAEETSGGGRAEATLPAHNISYEEFISAVRRGDLPPIEEYLKISGNATQIHALSEAARYNRLDVIERILQAGIMKSYTTNLDFSYNSSAVGQALMIAAHLGHAAVVERFLQIPDLNIKVDSRVLAKALVGATERNHVTVIEQLLNLPGIDTCETYEYRATN